MELIDLEPVEVERTRRLFTRVDSLLITALLALVCVSGALVHIRDNLTPSLALPVSEWHSEYHNENCIPTTNTSDDLLIHSGMSVSEGVSVVDTHGGALLTSLVKHHTASAVREYILSNNNLIRHSHTHTHESHMRTALLLSADVPIIQQVMQEVSEHSEVSALLTAVLGPHCSLTGLYSLTSEFGARSEEWHSSSPNSHAAQKQFFVKEMSLVLVSE
jgi:hypothetical protein